MENWFVLVAGMAVVVGLEILGYRIYKGFQLRKDLRFTEEGLGATFDDLKSMRDYLLESELVLNGCSDWGQSDREGNRASLDGLASGVRVQIDCIEPILRKAGMADELFVEKDDLRVKAPIKSLSEYADCAENWVREVVPAMELRARKRGFRDVAKRFRIAGESERRRADFARDLADGLISEEAEISLCLSCGSVYLGRRPAFCTVCNQPNFEMECIRRAAIG